jgi:hypothetical protein
MIKHYLDVTASFGPQYSEKKGIRKEKIEADVAIFCLYLHQLYNT